MAEQEIKLLCGEKTVDLNLPDSVQVLEMEPAEPLPNPVGAVRHALADPIERTVEGSCQWKKECLRGDF